MTMQHEYVYSNREYYDEYDVVEDLNDTSSAAGSAWATRTTTSYGKVNINDLPFFELAKPKKQYKNLTKLPYMIETIGSIIIGDSHPKCTIFTEPDSNTDKDMKELAKNYNIDSRLAIEYTRSFNYSKHECFANSMCVISDILEYSKTLMEMANIIKKSFSLLAWRLNPCVLIRAKNSKFDFLKTYADSNDIKADIFVSKFLKQLSLYATAKEVTTFSEINEPGYTSIIAFVT